MSADEPLPDVLSRREQQVLLTQPRIEYPVEFRNLVFLRIELNYGLRLPEVRALSWDQIDLDNGKIQVKGVEARDRVLWMHEDDVSLARDWKRQQECCLKKRSLKDTRPVSNQTGCLPTWGVHRFRSSISGAW